MFGLGLGLLALGGCSEPGPSGPSGREIMDSMVTNTITPDVTAFRSAAHDMQGEVEAFCAAPDAATLAELQDGWRALSGRWNAIAAYNIGPLDDDLIAPKIISIESMRLQGTDYTDTVRESYAAALSEGETLDAAYFDSLNFNKIGMLALEVLVFEDSREGHSTDPAAVLEDFEAEPRKCEYLAGMMDLLVACAEAVEYGWVEEFGESGQPFADAMLENRLEDGAQPIEALLIAIFEHLNYVKIRKLEAILDAQLSGHFYANQLALLDAIELLLTQPEGIGIFDYMRAQSFTAEIETVETNLAAAKQAAMDEDREALTASFGLLEGNFKREIPDGLGVSLGLTFTDGD